MMGMPGLYLLCTESLGNPYHFLPCLCRAVWMMWVLGLLSSMYRIFGKPLQFPTVYVLSPLNDVGCWACYLVCTVSLGNPYHFLRHMWRMWVLSLLSSMSESLENSYHFLPSGGCGMLGLLSSMYNIFGKPLPFPATHVYNPSWVGSTLCMMWVCGSPDLAVCIKETGFRKDFAENAEHNLLTM